MFMYRFVSVPKEFHYEDIPQEEMKSYFELDFLSVTDLFNNEVFNLGNYPYIKELVNRYPHFFNDEETNKLVEDFEIRRCDKNAILVALEALRAMVASEYERILSLDENALRGEIMLKRNLWNSPLEAICNTDEEIDNEVNSRLWEYQIFDLTRIYKTFDFDNNYLVLLGW